jgi:flagellar hook-associated protein 1 FlgK
MSSLTAITNSALTALQANQLGISIASNNISNAQNPNYTRQQLVTVPAVTLGSFTGDAGVQVQGIDAYRDKMIDSQLLQANSNSSGADYLNQTLSNIEVQFNDSNGTGLLNSITNFFNSFQTLASDPASTNFRLQVESSAQSLNQSFQALHDNLTNAQTQLNQSISDDSSTINGLATQIAQLNGEIANQEARGGSASDFQDQRAALVNQLGEIASVHEITGSDGSYQLTIGNNRLLVYNTQTVPLTTQPGTNGATRVMSNGVDITSELSGGKLAAAVDARDNYIPKYLNSLDQLAYDIVSNVNSVHSTGYDLNGNTGTNFFQPLTGVANASAQMSLNPAIAADPTKIAASGQPTGQDNQTASALGNLLTQQVFTGGAVTDEYKNLVFAVGSDVANSQTSLQNQQAMAQQLQTRRESISGVSIDQETIQILQFQQAYQASARVINTIDQLTQTILGIGTGA